MKLTDNEYSIMNALWEAEKPLNTAGIIEHCADKRWKANSIHILINSMLAKGAIEVVGFEKTARTYSRTFAPTCSRSEYMVRAFTRSQPMDDAFIRDTTAAFIQDPRVSDATLDYLAGLIQQRKGKQKDSEGE